MATALAIGSTVMVLLIRDQRFNDVANYTPVKLAFSFDLDDILATTRRFALQHF